VSAFEFSITVSGLDPSSNDFQTRFFDAGCDDTTVSFKKGNIIVEFTREAPSIEEAIAAAVECIKAAGATVERVETDPTSIKILRYVHESAKRLHASGHMDDKTMREFDALCGGSERLLATLKTFGPPDEHLPPIPDPPG
jgi:hypothetical protein